MQLLIKALLVTTLVAGIFCQKITFDAGGITVGRYYINGTIGENVTQLLHEKWQPFIYTEVKKINESTFFLMCVFDLSGATCSSDPADRCQCFYNTRADNVQFVVNGTADPDLYKAIIRARWRHTNRTTVYSNKNYTVPGPKVTTTASTTPSTTTSGTTSTTTSTTAESSSSSSSSTSSVLLSNTTSTDDRMSAKRGSCPLYFCDLYLAFSLLFLELLGGVAYAIIWWIFFKKDKGKAARTNDASSKSV